MKYRKNTFVTTVAALSFAAFSSAALANDIEGQVESVNKADRTFEVQGITFTATSDTDYDDGLSSFDDISEDQKVEVDFEYRDGNRYATEVELED